MSAEPTKPQPTGAKSDMWKRRVGAFWLRKGRGGDSYLSGTLIMDKLIGRTGDVHVSLLKNPSKKAPNHPDYEVFLQREEVADDFLGQARNAAGTATKEAQP